LWQQILACDIK